MNTLRLPAYGGKSTQYISLDGEPRDLPDVSPSGASLHESSPTDSGFFDFDKYASYENLTLLTYIFSLPVKGSGPDRRIDDNEF